MRNNKELRNNLVNKFNNPMIKEKLFIEHLLYKRHCIKCDTQTHTILLDPLNNSMHILLSLFYRDLKKLTKLVQTGRPRI